MFMNAKKISEVGEKKKNPVMASIDFFGSLKSEFKTVSWTSKVDLRKYTKVIVISMLLSGFSVYFADLVIQKVLNVTSLLTRLIFG